MTILASGAAFAKPGVWMRAATKKYYYYIMCYVDDILCISNDSSQKMGEIQENVKFNNDNIEEPYLYLGDILKKRELNG